jgi:AcrR family transcriptional regulator
MSPRVARAVSGVDGDAGAALRAHLLDVAEGLLAERSVTAITTRELARAAEVSEGVLYNYFADKNDLVLTALVHRFAALVARLEAAAPEAGERSLAENVATLAEALFALHVEAMPIIGRLLAEPSLLHRFMHDIHARTQPFGGKQIRDAVLRYLSDEQRLGRIATGVDIDAATDLLIGGVALLSVPAMTGAPSRAAQKARARSFAHTLVGGLT